MARQLDELIENPAPRSPPAAGADEPLYLNRELSLLDFQERVLAETGIGLSDWEVLDDDDRKQLEKAFGDVFPVLTPLAVDPGHPFPYISNLSLNLAVIVGDPVTGERRFARVKVPPLLPRFVVMPDGERFVALEQVIAAHLPSLFPGMEIECHHGVPGHAQRRPQPRGGGGGRPAGRRGARAAPAAVRAGRAPGARRADVRRGAQPPRARAGGGPRRRLRRRRPARRERAVGGPQPRSARAEGRAVVPAHARRAHHARGGPCDVFEVLRRRDVLVHHPYESFSTTVEAFIRQAAPDPDVLAIKQTLYRTSGDSPIVEALISAAEQDKQVAVLVELKARFDEQANSGWARAVEAGDAGLVAGRYLPPPP